MAQQDEYLLIDFDDCQMETELKCRASLAERVNFLYGNQLPEPFTSALDREFFTGLARQSYCQAISVKYGIPVDYEAVYDRREERLQESLKTMEGGITMAPNLIESLSELKNEGVKFALVSNSPVDRCKILMQQANNGRGEELLALFNGNFFSSGDVQKPKPDVYLNAMKTLGVTPAQCVAIEDSKTGVKAATAAGLVTFGYTGFSEKPDDAATALSNLGTTAIMQDWGDFPALYRANRHLRR